MARFPICSQTIVSVVSSLLAAASLTGCTLGSYPPGATSDPVTSTLGSIQGNNYGGHAPIVGAHVFVLEGYASANGYGQPAKSLLSAAYTGSSYPTAKEPAGTAMANNYYVTTDANGYFNVTGDYTCDAGYPVYLYAQGGNPQAPLAYQTSISVTGATISGTGPYTITFTVPAPSLLYQGETITFTGSGGNLANYLNGSVQTVLADSNLTTTSFDITVNSLTNNGVTVTTGTQSSVGNLTITQTSAPNNPAIVNLAVLGLCPSTGTANFSYLNFVYMNEVSTAAAAYALGGFFPAPGSSGLAIAGAAAGNLSVPNSTADPVGYSQALLGLQNAALTASQLYDIQGSNSACTGNTCNGETHIARPATVGILTGGNTTIGSPTVTNVSTTGGLTVGMTITGANLPAGETIAAIGTNTLTLSSGTGVTAATGAPMFAGSGNGTVPQALINTVGNILANCVDSNNTSAATSPQCTSLFSYARSAGTSGTLPIDIASAAIDIAHNPWANVTSLVNLPTGNVPFVPKLSTANDLSVGILYKPTRVSTPEGIAIDKRGQIWYANPGVGYVTALNPFGGVQYNIYVGGTPHYMTIDGNGSDQAWVTNTASGYQGLQRINAANGTYTGIYGSGTFLLNYGVAADGVNDTGYIYIGGGATGTYKFYGNGIQTTTPGNPLTGSTPASCTGTVGQASHISVDNANNNTATGNKGGAAGGYNLWIAQELGPLCEVNTSTGALITEITFASPATTDPETPAIDASGNAWIPEQLANTMLKVTQTGTATNPSGGTLSNPFGAAVDGNGNVFVTNRVGNGVTEFLGSTGAAVSSTNFYGGGSSTVMSDPLNLLADQSGNLWITNYNGSQIVEILGVAAPTWQPLADAAYYNKLGSRP